MVLARRICAEGDFDDVLPDLPENEEQTNLPRGNALWRHAHAAKRKAPDKVRDAPLVEDVLVHVNAPGLVYDRNEGAPAFAAE